MAGGITRTPDGRLEWGLIPDGSLSAEGALRIRDGYEDICRSFPEAIIERAMDRWTDRRRAVRIHRLLVNQIGDAAPYIWNSDIWNLATEGHEVFEGVSLQPSDLPDTKQMWLFEGEMGEGRWNQVFDVPAHCRLRQVFVGKGIGIRNDRAAEGASREGWIPAEDLSGRMGLTIGLVFVPAFDQGEQFDSVEDVLPYVRFLPTLFEGDAFLGSHTWAMAALRFLRLPFVQAETVEMSRQVRRHYERKTGKPATVRTVLLRKSSKEAKAVEGSKAAEGSQGGVDWSCQWLVRGHWRKRAERYGPGDPFYVSPYLKGPDDKPFRAPREAVYLVKR